MELLTEVASATIKVGMTISMGLVLIVFLPQIAIILKRKSSDDVALLPYLISIFMQTFGLLDVIMHQSWSHVALYSLSLGGCIFCFYMGAKYRSEGNKFSFRKELRDTKDVVFGAIVYLFKSLGKKSSNDA